MKHATRRMKPLLGTFVEVGSACPSAQDSPAFDAAFSAIEQIHNLLSFHNPQSDLSRLNYSFGNEVELHPHSLRVLRLAKAMSCASDGLFNPTVGGKLQSLGYLPDHSSYFQSSEIPLPIGEAFDIQMRRKKVFLARPVRVVLDGIAKGYAVDLAIKALKQAGLSNGWVNAGGDIRVYGDVVLPLQIRGPEGLGETLGGLQNMSVATTWVKDVYDQSFPGWVVLGDRKPALGVWTVLAKKAWRADALTKVASLAFPEERAEIMARLGGRCL
ncbi:FAD:protein FMN transferase [Bdellovibrio sp. BCCA]|uniref:FAD:protein FMN transferase n=1 Tax=Bdellovibrio sp. BCCA TaxID=3136281 RepID=UPI0030EFA79B